MKVFIIRMPDNQKSCLLASRAYESCVKFGYETEYLNALDHESVNKYFIQKNMKEIFNPEVPYYESHKHWIQFKGMRGSVCSHISLWEKCIEINEPIIIFEHDALMNREWPDIDWVDVLHLDWEGSLKRRSFRNGPDIYRGKIIEGIFETGFSPFDMPELITMNCVYAYAIKPHAAEKAINDVYQNGFFAADRILREPIVTMETIMPKIAEEQPEAITMATTSE